MGEGSRSWEYNCPSHRSSRVNFGKAVISERTRGSVGVCAGGESAHTLHVWWGVSEIYLFAGQSSLPSPVSLSAILSG